MLLGSGTAVAGVCGLAAVAPISPLAWESLYAAGVALEKAKRKKNYSNKIIDSYIVIMLTNESLNSLVSESSLRA